MSNMYADYPPLYIIETLTPDCWIEELPVFNSLIGAWTHWDTLKESDPQPRRILNVNAMHIPSDEDLF